MSSKFELDKFVVAPTEEQFEQCRKDDLMLIADFYNIELPRSALKREIKEILHTELVKQKVLPGTSVITGVATTASSDDLEAAEAEFKSEDIARMDPVSPSTKNPLLAIRLKELEVELCRQQYQNQLLHVRAVELETQRDIRLKELELELKTRQARRSPSPVLRGNSPVQTPVQASSPLPAASSVLPVSSDIDIDISRQISLVPTFRESEVDTYFTVFERIAATLKWPRNIWPLLLQCKLVGKAQEVCSALTIEQSLDYDSVKAAVLRAYELVPEAYRQKFRKHVKNPSQTFVEFAREKTTLFEKWCTASKITTLEQLKELILVEEFKNCISEKIVVYLNEQKASSLSEAAIFADEFVLTHKVAFTSPRSSRRTVVERNYSSKATAAVPKDDQNSDSSVMSRECFYCHEKGHLIAACPVLKRKSQRKAQSTYKSVSLVHTHSSDSLLSIDPSFEPFVCEGVVAFSELDPDPKPVRILRDTGAAQSFVLAGVLPFSSQSSCNSDVLVQGIELGVVVVPKSYRENVLSVAHDHELSGHLGIKKTYYNLLKHFFWPGIKSTVSQYCRSCHACQVAGKPNQVISPAPLKPIPVMNEPFEKLVIDCVGPLPRTKSGHSYLLTLMCSATRFPEAIPLRSLKTPTIVKAIVKFCTTFGLPKFIQSDQGSNFMSRVFRKVMKELNIKHCISTAYHPQSQGVLERFHQTLKTMIRTYCLQHQKDWDEEIPLLLFAVRNTMQESLGFSPAELVFGHSLRGPLKVLQEQLLSVSQTDASQKNVLDHVSSFRERLHLVWQLAQKSLANSQTRMKGRYDKRSVRRSFKVGDQVLVLLPLPGSALQAKFTGPYVIEAKLSDTDYVVGTPERRRKTRVCHINMLKLYVSRPDTKDSAPPSVLTPAAVTSVDVVASEYSPCVDGLHLGSACLSGARLQNSEALVTLHSKLSHLSSSSQSELIQLINKYSSLFSDVPTVSNVLMHDIDVGDHPPVKQNAYRVNPAKREIMERETRYLVENGLAVPSCSPWCSPCLLVPKPDGTSRFCTDYRKVNQLTKSHSYPLPRMEDCVDRVGKAKFVTKLDLLKGYWQVPLTERASEISAFVTPDAFLQYKVLPFGLKNAPATFQRLMNQVLANVKHCEAYLDDVVCYSDTWNSHLQTLEEVFSRFQAANLTLNLAKCEFCHATVTYLGKEVGHGTVRPLEAKVQAIVEFPVPKSKRDLRRFLGMAGYYRNFCKNFSDVVKPLTDILRKAVSFNWDTKCEIAFESLKTLLCNAPVLAAPDFSRPFKLEVDASGTGAGAVLLQEDDYGIDHP
ncbi:hypothetical protein M9458_050705, partial [Cirrhinus mrigala]